MAQCTTDDVTAALLRVETSEGPSVEEHSAERTTLLVAGNAATAQTVRLALKQCALAVQHSSTLEEALFLARPKRHRLIIAQGSDELEPGSFESLDSSSLDGGPHGPQGALHRLRHVAGCPILWLGAQGSVEEEIAALKHGADIYLAPPFSLETIACAAASLLRVQSGQYQLGLGVGVTLNVARRAVVVHGRSVTLPHSAFTLLALLSRSPGSAIPTRVVCRRLGLTAHSDAALEAVRYLRRRLRGTGVRIRCQAGHVVLCGSRGTEGE